MNSTFSELPTAAFHIIRQYVGERYPFISTALVSHIFQRINTIRYMGVTLEIDEFYPHIPHDYSIRCHWDKFYLQSQRKPYLLNTIVALGSFTYLRDWFEFDTNFQALRRTHTMNFTSEYRSYWTMGELFKKIRMWEYVVRTQLMHRFDNGHIYLEGFEITNNNTIRPYWGS